MAGGVEGGGDTGGVRNAPRTRFVCQGCLPVQKSRFLRTQRDAVLEQTPVHEQMPVFMNNACVHEQMPVFMNKALFFPKVTVFTNNKMPLFMNNTRVHEQCPCS